MISRGALCNVCNSISSDHFEQISNVYLENTSEPETYLGVIGGILGNFVFHRKLLGAIGVDKLQKLGRIVTVCDEAGKILPSFLCLLINERTNLSLTRGTVPNQPSVCKMCGRLRYWPGWPPETWYILRRDWTSDADIAFMRFPICSPHMWELVIRPLGLEALDATRLSVVDAARDGWPDNAEAIAKECVSRGLVS